MATSLPNETATAAVAGRSARTKDSVMAASVIAAHIVEHIYTRGFVVLIPYIYSALGLVPIQAGLMEAIRQLSSGATSICSGILADIYQRRRGQLLALAMLLLGMGYLLVGLAPTYTLILAALVVGQAGSALWHPPALGFLAERFPARKGLLISLHRSTGNIGDSIGPLIVGSLLLAFSWRPVVEMGIPLVLLLSLLIALFLRPAGTAVAATVGFRHNLLAQFRLTRESFRGFGMSSLLTVSALRGMADRSLVLFLPFYLKENLGMNSVAIGFHVTLLAVLGIVADPIIGSIGDRGGRKHLIVGIMLMSTVLTSAMILSRGGIGLTLSIAAFGLFFFSVNSLTQAAAIDLAGGKRLQGTFIGLMWGNNALFSAVSPIVAGVLAKLWGFQAAFYYAAILFFLGFLVSLSLPAIKPYRLQPA